MTRPPPAPKRSDIAETEFADFDFVVERQRRLWAGAPRNSDPYFGALLNSPPVAAALARLGRVMREGQLRGSYSDADRELVDVVLSVDFGYHAILALHIPDALAVGVRLEAIEALWHGDEQSLTPEERFRVAYVRAVASGSVEDQLFAEVCATLGLRGAIEYTAFIAFLVMTIRLWQALGVPDVTREEIEAILRSYREGSAPKVDPRARVG